MAINQQQHWKSVTYPALITAITTILISTGSLNSIDTLHRLQVTRSLWTDAPQVIEEVLPDDVANKSTAFSGVVTYSVIGRDQKRYVTWGIGQSLVMLPADIMAQTLINAISPEQPVSKTSSEVSAQSQSQYSHPQPKVVGIVSYLTFPLINVLAIIASFYLLKNLEFTTSQSIYGALSLLFCTTFLHYSQTHQENSLDFLLTTSGYLFHLLWLTTNSYKFLCLGMLSLGFNLLVRLTLAINLISVNIFTISSLYLQTKIQTYSKNAGDRHRSRQKTIFKYLAIAAIVYGSFLGMDRFYHWLRFDNFTGTYTGIWTEQVKAIFPELPKSFPFSTPFMDGFLGFFFSPNRSIFLFNPLILVTLYISIKHWQELSYKLRTFLLSLVFLLFATIITYSTWFLWGGAGAWGNRYTTTASQLISFLAIPLALKFIFKIPLAPIHDSLFKKLEKLGLILITIVSSIIQISSIIFDPNLELLQFKSLQNDALLFNVIQDQPLMFTVGQRLINVMALLTNNFDNWGLRPNLVSLEQSQKLITLAFFPWLNASRIFSTNIVVIIQICWFILLLILLYLLFKLITNTNHNEIDINSDINSDRQSN